MFAFDAQDHAAAIALVRERACLRLQRNGIADLACNRFGGAKLAGELSFRHCDAERGEISLAHVLWQGALARRRWRVDR